VLSEVFSFHPLAIQFLEELFGARHALLAVSNMATLGHQIYRRMSWKR
jgi:hypothetical protein